MIPIQKLVLWPDEARHRKILRVLTELEKAFVENRGAGTGDAEGAQTYNAEYHNRLCACIADDATLPDTIRQNARLAAGTLDRKPLNALRHSVAAYLGRDCADWDMILPAGTLNPGVRTVKDFVLYLDDIRSPYNIGAVFRAAESFGVREICLSAGCASPEHPRARRTSAGAVDVIPYHIREPIFVRPGNPNSSCSSLNPSTGRTAAQTVAPVFGLETGGTPIREFRFPERGIAVIGSEELGLGTACREAAEAGRGLVSIPTAGAKGSLNVAVAVGILLEHWFSSVSVAG
jgi:RNA methyltransferase, TrmH family